MTLARCNGVAVVETYVSFTLDAFPCDHHGVTPVQSVCPMFLARTRSQHMPSHVEFRSGLWHKASEANLRSVALPDVDAEYPEHNLDMLM